MTNSALTVIPSPKDVAAIAKQWAPNTLAAHPVLNHVAKTIELRSNLSARTMNNVSATVQVFAHGMNIDDWHEIWQLQQAALQRLLTLQNGWMEAWKGWYEYASHIKGANTMTKLVEREGNIAAQFSQLLSNQATDLMGLQENIQIDYAYWINQKLNEIQHSGPAA